MSPLFIHVNTIEYYIGMNEFEDLQQCIVFGESRYKVNDGKSKKKKST